MYSFLPLYSYSNLNRSLDLPQSTEDIGEGLSLLFLCYNSPDDADVLILSIFFPWIV